MTGITLEIIAGLLLLVSGGEALVRGSVTLARNLGVSKLVIGLVLVGFGTSMPELVTSLDAALIGSPGIALGNVIGSNIANTLLILGLTAAITPIACDPRAFRRDGPMLAIATLLCIGFALSGAFGRGIGLLFVAVLLGYTVFTYRAERCEDDASARLHRHEAELGEPTPQSTWLGVLIAVAGVGLLIAGAHFMVTGSVALARQLGVSETIIGLTLVAVGTSLPELSISLVAAVRRQTDLAFGNIIGSNIFNILGILGVAAIVAPIAVPPKIVDYDLWILAATTLLLIVFAMTDWKLSRREGLIFFAGYAGYVALAVLRAFGAA